MASDRDVMTRFTWCATCGARVAALAFAWASLSVPATALDITGYSAVVNDRFSSGFPTTPVPNTDPSFVGNAYDWSGIAWSTTTYAASSYKGFAMLSPSHFLTAQHYENGALLTSAVRIRTNSGSIVSQSNSGPVDNLGYGVEVTNVFGTAKDLAIGTLTAPIAAPQSFARYAVLDLYSTSSSTVYSVYNGLPVLAYGRGSTTNGSPRVAATTINQAGIINSDPAQTTILTLRAGAGSVQLVEGDSGSPILRGWVNPDGGSELTVLGLNSGINTTYNFMSFLAVPGAMANANTVMNPDGFALRVAGNPTATWTGNASSSIGIGANYAGTPSLDNYFAFDADVAVTRSVNVDSDTQPRGMFFLSTASGSDGFTFSGGTLTIGRGGIVNYDNSVQTISAPIALGASQYWDVGPGGVTVGAINNGGFLLEVAGSGTATITGNVSGTGGVALSGSRLVMNGTSSYTGRTWVHSGTLVVNGSIASSSGVTINPGGSLVVNGSIPTAGGMVVPAGSSLGGSGVVGAISGAGSVGPGNSPGILTAPSVNPTGGLDFNFEFTQLGNPTWSNAVASGNDVLRLTDGTTPFTTALTSNNTINVYLNVGSLSFGNTFRGGFFTDRDVEFLASVGNATFSYFLADAGGAVDYNGVTYSPYAGPYTFDWSTVSVTADFSGGSSLGYVSQFTAVPEPGTWGLLVFATAGAAWLRRRGRPTR
jgi:autotransporter-associated beta strand protein